ncbi:MAG: hypothetical protein ACD_47C00332G0002 [uncultured bacterium]|nr:MAG: hypothetical protein ACD_47C00332G0002 [uncultured bacterium]
MKQLKVDAIKDGTVIDHIPAGKAMKVLNILKLKNSDVVMVGVNLASRKFAKKDLIKIENRELSGDEVDRIALIAPDANISIIRNFEVVKKSEVNIPEKLSAIIVCQNHKCITNTEPVTTCFYVEARNPIMVRCHYCEKSFGADEIKIAGIPVLAVN